MRHLGWVEALRYLGVGLVLLALAMCSGGR
jgi:hypothetical protein